MLAEVVTGRQNGQPQWSPPLIGGSTLYVMGGWAHYLRQPQWSPPLIGGSTP